MKAPLLVFFVVILLGSVAQAAGWNPAILADANSGSHAPLFRYTWLDSVSGPSDTTWTDTALQLTGAAMLHASQDAESLMVVIQGWSQDHHWAQLRYYDLHAGDSVQVDWSHEFESESAYQVVRESIIDSLPILLQQDSFVTWRFLVLTRGGVADRGKEQVTNEKPQPSILRRFPAGAIAFDAMGKQVTNPKPGVYFLRGAPAALPRKVLLVE
jgi:hypothetical protein